jgi:membrane-bound acyltransferase YfiQ involved in biofilm formation
LPTREHFNLKFSPVGNTKTKILFCSDRVQEGGRKTERKKGANMIVTIIAFLLGMILGRMYVQDHPNSAPKIVKIVIQILAILFLISIMLTDTPANALSAAQRYTVLGIAAVICGSVFSFSCN